CLSQGINLRTIVEIGETFSKLELFDDFANILLGNDDLRKEFNVYDNTIVGLYEACRPDILKYRAKYAIVEVIHYLRGVIDSHIGFANIERAEDRISELWDQSVLISEEAKGWCRSDEESAKYQIKAYKKKLS